MCQPRAHRSPWAGLHHATVGLFFIVGLVLWEAGPAVVAAAAADARTRPAEAPAQPAPATLVVRAAETPLCLAVPLPEGIMTDTADTLRLAPAKASGEAPDEVSGPSLPAQLVPLPAADGKPDTRGTALAAVVGPRPESKTPQRFVLRPADRAPAPKSPFEFRDRSPVSLALYEDGRPVLAYNHGTVVGTHVPENDARRRRACYIHPLWGLNGEVLTDDFPRDHYHHHGVFWAWPHVKYGGREYDLWMGKGIRQQFVAWLDRRAGPVCAQLAVENGWFVEKKKVMIERVWLRVYRAQAGWRAIDMQFTWIPVDQPITLQGAGGKSYGGLTVRFAPRNREATVITVPEGRTTADLYNTRLKWVDFTSVFDKADQPSGAAVFVRPDHPDYPPTWLTRHYGPQCVGWPGVEARTFPPGKPIHAAYRIWIHKSAGELDQLTAAYQGWLAGLKARWE